MIGVLLAFGCWCAIVAALVPGQRRRALARAGRVLPGIYLRIRADYAAFGISMREAEAAIVRFGRALRREE